MSTNIHSQDESDTTGLADNRLDRIISWLGQKLSWLFAFVVVISFF